VALVVGERYLDFVLLIFNLWQSTSDGGHPVALRAHVALPVHADVGQRLGIGNGLLEPGLLGREILRFCAQAVPAPFQHDDAL
jgi:hypothetical protein